MVIILEPDPANAARDPAGLGPAWALCLLHSTVTTVIEKELKRC